MPEKYIERPGAVFLSYHQSGAADVPRWVTKVLHPLLEEQLPHQGIDTAPVFIDEVSIQGGQDWPQALKDALRDAAVLVPVFTPQYFRRPWCQAELNTMLDRRRRLAHDCILPVRFSDGDFFSEEAKALTPAFDAERWAHIGTHRRAPKGLRDGVKELARQVADAVRSAPPDHDWEFVVPVEDEPNFLSKPGYRGDP